MILLNELRNDLEESDDIVWREALAHIQPESRLDDEDKKTLRNQTIEIHFNRENKLINSIGNSDDRRKHVARMMWCFLSWGLREETRSEIEDDINQRLNQLDDSSQSMLRKLWGHKDKPGQRDSIISELERIANDALGILRSLS